MRHKVARVAGAMRPVARPGLGGQRDGLALVCSCRRGCRGGLPFDGKAGVQFGPDEKARLLALHKKTGQIVWEVEPPKVDPSEQQQMRGARGGPGSPEGERGGGGDGEGSPGSCASDDLATIKLPHKAPHT